MSHPDPTKEYSEEESMKVWSEACNDGNNNIDELPSIYSDDAPPHMQMRMLWNKVNEIIKKLNKQND